MKSIHWALVGAAAAAAALLYYAAKPVARLTFYDPEIITSVKDPPTVVSIGDVDAVTGDE
jgi:hypothetical protein